MVANAYDWIFDPSAAISQNQLSGTKYRADTDYWIAYLQALSQLQQQGLVNTGGLDIEKQRGQNTLDNTGLQGRIDLDRQGLINSGNLDVTKLQGLNAQQLQALVNSGQLDLGKLQGQNALALAGLNNSGALQQILAQNQGAFGLAGLNNDAALQRAMIELQGTLAPVEAQNKRFDTTMSLISPLLAQFFGVDPATLSPAGAAGQQGGGNTLQGATEEQLRNQLQAKMDSANKAWLPEPQDYEGQLARDNYINFISGRSSAEKGFVDPRYGRVMPDGFYKTPGIQFAPGDPRAAAQQGGTARNAMPFADPKQAARDYHETYIKPGNWQPAAKTNPGQYGPPTPNTGGTGNTGNNGVPGGTTNPSGSRGSAGPRPQISTGPIWGTQQIGAMKNRSDADAAKQQHMANKSAQTRMGQAGFSTASPAMAALQNRNAIASSQQQAAGRLNIDTQTAQANAQHQLDAQKAAGDLWSQDALTDWRYYDTDRGGMSSLLSALLGLAR